ncbi:MAG: JAB domain-containing protein [Planctomycetota bacterium]
MWPDSGGPDREVTARLADVAKLVGIRMLDHVIDGVTGYSSFAEEGLLQGLSPWPAVEPRELRLLSPPFAGLLNGEDALVEVRFGAFDAELCVVRPLPRVDPKRSEREY